MKKLNLVLLVLFGCLSSINSYAYICASTCSSPGTSNGGDCPGWASDNPPHCCVCNCLADFNGDPVIEYYRGACGSSSGTPSCPSSGKCSSGQYVCGGWAGVQSIEQPRALDDPSNNSCSNTNTSFTSCYGPDCVGTVCKTASSMGCVGSSTTTTLPSASLVCDSAQYAKGCTDGSTCCLCPKVTSTTATPPSAVTGTPPTAVAVSTSTGAPPTPPSSTGVLATTGGTSSSTGTTSIKNSDGTTQTGCTVPSGAVLQSQQKNGQCPWGYTSVIDYCSRPTRKLCAPNGGSDSVWGAGRPMLGPPTK